jgi:hypothetical protein
MTEAWLSRRFFRRLPDKSLINADGFARRGVMAGRANREIRRRAKRAGFAGPYEWLVALAQGTSPGTAETGTGSGA